MPPLFDNIPDELARVYAIIGSVASAWSHIESAADVSIWRLANLEHNHGACLTAHISNLRTKLLCLLSLMNLQEFDKVLIKRMYAFSTAVDKVSRLRNRVVHDPISHEDGMEPQTITITADKRLNYRIADINITEYLDINSRIANLLAEYIELDKEMVRFVVDRSTSIREAHFSIMRGSSE